MSDAMYPQRLRWHHTLGVARCDGVTVELKHPPRLPGMEHMMEMDYIPGVIAEVRIGCSRTREMTGDERGHALELITRMARIAHEALE